MVRESFRALTAWFDSRLTRFYAGPGAGKESMVATVTYRVVTLEAGRWVPLSGPVVGLGTAWALARVLSVSRRIPLRLCRIVHAIGAV